MQLVEPQRGVELIRVMNEGVSSSQTLFAIISVLADAIVFLFPIFLAVVYIIGIKKNDSRFKEYALRIFSSSVVAIILNIVIQMFCNKARPESVLEGTGGLLLKHLPTMSFPSDHAAVSMAFGIAAYYFLSLLVGARTHKIMKGWAIFFIIGSIVMSLARVAVGVHWPTDIIAGWAVGAIGMTIVHMLPQSIYTRIISLEKKLTGLFIG